MPANPPRVIVALDFADPGHAVALADRLDPRQCAVKVGKELFVVAGPEPVRRLVERGFNVFLDLKFHDIPNTVAQACAAATRLGVWMVDVHAAGGRAMLTAARDAVATAATGQGGARPLLVAVTVLTSLDAAALAETGIAADPGAQALRLATLARDCGLDGVVCSAVEAPLLRAALGPDFALVTPGIRPAGSATDDQARIVAPEQALALGASYLVIGRPITAATDPVAALAAINRSLGTSA
ncbi:MAG: orotidine-5'-phosphate decarboxylase [Betaproteobacteria bacterium]|nr:orotidine-5'-phosphate decarboxylase [Betaproteobacteria bacterium]MDE2209926.1 orotidine-5'-phosphate decarboxylase [Betaproteobacteria bacterium]MDE2361020.1 orotidine-5'-phosphate decarboxylase [Betaproteobacteria bacterium]